MDDNKTTIPERLLGELIAEVRSLKDAFSKTAGATTKRIDDLHRANEKALDEIKEKNEKQDSKIDAINEKVTRNTTICTIVIACITATLIAVIKLEIL